MQPAKTIIENKKRLRFIDLGRSIAILLMLEGHFTGAALDSSYRNSDYLLYNIWHLLHGITAPLFFTFTGLIFVYLLLGNESYRFWNNPRVTKGFKRIVDLLFWGYLVQLNAKAIYKIYLGKSFDINLFFGFHVLQSIALCIALILATYGIYRMIKKGSVFIYFIAMAAVMLVISSLLKQYIVIDESLMKGNPNLTPNYWPHHFPVILQNVFYGPRTAFSFVHTSIYALIGGAMGAIIRLNEIKVREYSFILKFILGGLLTLALTIPVLSGLDYLLLKTGLIEIDLFKLNISPLARLGQVITIVGLLMLIEKLIPLKDSLFLKVGQHTLPIYILHVIILYGGITGFGLKPDLFDRNLSPFLAVLISAIAIAMSMLLVKYIEPLERIYTRIFKFWKQNKS